MDEPVVQVIKCGNKFQAIAELGEHSDFALADTEPEARAKALHRLRERMNNWGWPR
jgi:hypothetical protein